MRGTAATHASVRVVYPFFKTIFAPLPRESSALLVAVLMPLDPAPLSSCMKVEACSRPFRFDRAAKRKEGREKIVNECKATFEQSAEVQQNAVAKTSTQSAQQPVCLVRIVANKCIFFSLLLSTANGVLNNYGDSQRIYFSVLV